MQLALLALITLSLIAQGPYGNGDSHLVITNEAPYPIIASVLRQGELVLKEPLLPGGEMSLSIEPGSYILHLRPAIPYYIELNISEGVLLQNPYMVIPIDLSPGETQEYAYGVGNLSKAQAGMIVIRSPLNITDLWLDNTKISLLGNHLTNHSAYRAVIVVSSGTHEIGAVLTGVEPFLCALTHRMNLNIEPGEILVLDIPPDISRYIKNVTITNYLSKTVHLQITAKPLETAYWDGTDMPAPIQASIVNRYIDIPAHSSISIRACLGDYIIRAWGMNSPKEIAVRARLIVNASTQGANIYIPQSLGVSALLIQPTDCVTEVIVSGKEISVSLPGNESALLLLHAGEYKVTALLRECGVINEAKKYVAWERLRLGEEKVFAVPKASEVLIRNDANYEVIFSITNSGGGLVHAEILPARSSTLVDVWPGNYTVVANPARKPTNYVGPLSGLRWVSRAELLPGRRTVLEIKPSPEAVIEIRGPPGARVVISWGTSSATYTIPPNGTLKLWAAAVSYSVISCPTDIFHDCWETVIDAVKSSKVVIHYGIKVGTIVCVALAASGTGFLTYLVVKRIFRRTGREGTETPP